MSKEMSACPAAWEHVAQPVLNTNRTWQIKSLPNIIAVASGPSQLALTSAGGGSRRLSPASRRDAWGHPSSMVGTVPGPGCPCEPGGGAPLEGEIWVIASQGTRLPERVIELQLNCSSAGIC